MDSTVDQIEVERESLVGVHRSYDRETMNKHIAILSRTMVDFLKEYTELNQSSYRLTESDIDSISVVIAYYLANRMPFGGGHSSTCGIIISVLNDLLKNDEKREDRNESITLKNKAIVLSAILKSPLLSKIFSQVRGKQIRSSLDSPGTIALRMLRRALPDDSVFYDGAIAFTTEDKEKKVYFDIFKRWEEHKPSDHKVISFDDAVTAYWERENKQRRRK